MLVTPSGMLILVKPVQSRNAESPMFVTPSGIVTFPEQVVPSIKIPFTITSGFSFCLLVNQGVPENARFPMLVTLLGISMLVKLLHQENAFSPMHVTLPGIVMSVKLLQS